MFWFEGGDCLLNVAYRFDLRSEDGLVDYVYDVQAPGGRKLLNVDPILRHAVRDVYALDERHLALEFDNGRSLVIHDCPSMRSAWFLRYDPKNRRTWVWAEDDLEGESDLGGDIP